MLIPGSLLMTAVYDFEIGLGMGSVKGFGGGIDAGLLKFAMGF